MCDTLEPSLFGVRYLSGALGVAAPMLRENKIAASEDAAIMSFQCSLKLLGKRLKRTRLRSSSAAGGLRAGRP